tara:strand:- start:1460 stop:1987 length:528 start_codon:yes stop_codon:yes gene_type:complete
MAPLTGGGLLQLGLGAFGALNTYAGNKGITDIANNMPSEDKLRGAFDGSQGLIDRLTNFNQYSGQAMDLAGMQGNKGVEDAMMMGLGGSQANAIRNRMKRSSLTGVYDKFNDGMSTALNAQMGIDKNISGQLRSQEDQKRMIRHGQYSGQMGIGDKLMGEKGMRGLGGMLGSLFV